MLKAAGATAASLAVPGVARALAQSNTPAFDVDWNDETVYERVSFNEVYNYPPMLGRFEAFHIGIKDGPYLTSNSIRKILLNYIMPVYGAVRGDAPYPYLHNDVWYRIHDGYVHSSYVVPCREVFNAVEEDIGDGFWGELTVPMTWLRVEPTIKSNRYDFRTGYGTVFRVVESARGDDGQIWYRLEDDADERQPWWVQGRFIRRIHPDEFAPINPHVTDKRVEIDTLAQTLVAFENGAPVFQTRISSGTGFEGDDGTVYDFYTTYGEWAVQRKRPSRHMVGGEEINDIYDLPGVPWDTYFTYTGSAIHGTYWHNDFGRDRSHGCINVTHDAAKWLYRWTQPYLSHEDTYRWTEAGELATPVIVI
jgi:hypothetical protein